MKKRIFITGNKDKTGCEAAAQIISSFLKKKAEVVGIDLNKQVELPKERIDLIISLGGDGSFLNLVEMVVQRDIPIMGVNFGHMGFLTAGLSDELEGLLCDYLEGETMVFDRMVLNILIKKRAGILNRRTLNDVVIASPDLSRVASLYVKVSEEPLLKIRGDGLIVATPTGSTAHSLSAGGSLVDPKVDALLLTPLSPQSLSSRPLIIRSDAMIEVGVQNKGENAHILCDGQQVGTLSHGEEVQVMKSAERIRVVQPKNFKFFQRLREKLGWIDKF